MNNLFRLDRCGGFLSKGCFAFVLFCLSTATNPLHAQWIQTNGPYGGRVYSFAVSHDGAGGTYLFAGTYAGGVFRSTEKGKSWTAVNTGLTNTSVLALAVSPAAGGAGATNLFAGTNGGGVLISTNNGTSWAAVNTGLTSTLVYSLAVSGTNIFAGTWSGGVFRSTNNGTSWTPVNTGLTYPCVYAFAISGTNLFAGTQGGGVFLSTNNGTSWTAVNTGLTSNFVYSLAVSGTNIFAGTPGDGVFLSTNNGTSWTAVNTGLTNTSVQALAVSPAAGGAGATNLFAGTGGGVFLSTNNGTSWTAVNAGLTDAYVNALAVSGTNLIAGTGGLSGGGIFLSLNNGASWTATGLTNTFIYALAPDLSGNLFAGTIGGGVFLSTNDGTSWTAVNTGLTDTDVRALAVSPAPGGTGATNLFAGTGGFFGGGVFLSTNSGTNWSPVNTGLTKADVNALAVSPAAGGAGATNLFAGTGGGLFLSTNNGTSWTTVNTGLTNTYVNALAPDLSGNLFAGTYGGGVFLSTNNGSSWTPVNTGLTNAYVLALALSGTKLFAGTLGGGVFLSTNNGANWTAVNTGLTNVDVYALAVSHTYLFAGTGGGVFLSTKNGTNWTAVNAGLTSTYVNALAVSGTNLFAGTYGGSAMRRPLSEMVFPLVKITPSTMDFQNVKLGQSKDTTITITNGGNDTLKISNITSSNAVFSARPTTQNIPPSQSFTDTLRFTPIAFGIASGDILVYSNATSSPDTIKLSGNGVITGIGDFLAQIPKVYSLSQNYPNPFNPETTIKFGIPEASKVSLKIYDVLGREVATIVDKDLLPGYYAIPFNGANLSSGAYFYRIIATRTRDQSQTFVETKKLLLME